MLSSSPNKQTGYNLWNVSGMMMFYVKSNAYFVSFLSCYFLAMRCFCDLHDRLKTDGGWE